MSATLPAALERELRRMTVLARLEASRRRPRPVPRAVVRRVVVRRDAA